MISGKNDWSICRHRLKISIEARPKIRVDKPLMSKTLITLSDAGYGEASSLSSSSDCSPPGDPPGDPSMEFFILSAFVAAFRSLHSASRFRISGIKTRIIHSIMRIWWSTTSSAERSFSTFARCNFPVRSMYTGHPRLVCDEYHPLWYPSYVFCRTSKGISRQTRIFPTKSVFARHSIVFRNIFSAFTALPPCALKNRRYVSSRSPHRRKVASVTSDSGTRSFSFASSLSYSGYSSRDLRQL
mmetsp:Transcript_14182/g.47012  ORF Transcript_14182/g.47012 Transcript_14182/m.47012 type:complete len:242 (+) Transcript_14182:345-1070(+)